MTSIALAAVAVPKGLTLAAGGRRDRPLPFAPPPDIALNSEDAADILRLLDYAGVRYENAQSPAAAVGISIFKQGRALALSGRHQAVTFDWDHTLSHYQIFENLPQLIQARRHRVSPVQAIKAAPMVAIETARPFMTELAFGMMVGFALQQGLSRFSAWSSYEPKVGVATHTWPDRLALLASHYMPILPLMEGLLPGAPETYERFMAPTIRSAIHLHHFLQYATSIVSHFDIKGFAALSRVQRQEVMRYVEDAKAHHRKPLSVWDARRWHVPSLLHIDDSTRVIADLTLQATLGGHGDARFLHTPHPYSAIFKNVREWHKISLPGLWRKRPQAMEGVVGSLVRKEWSRSPVPALLRNLGGPAGDHPAWPKTGLPAGVVLTIHETPTTVGEFWDYYVDPVNQVQTLIRDVRRRRGGLRAIRRAYGKT